MTITENIRKYILPVLLVLAVIVSLLKPGPDNLTSVSGQMQATLNKAEAEFADIVKNKNTFESLSKGALTGEYFEKIAGDHIFLYYYQYDSLVAWTESSVFPSSGIGSIDSGTSFMKLKNGWYQVMKYVGEGGSKVLLGLIPVKYEYPFENKFLKNEFAAGMPNSSNIQLSDQKLPGSLPVKNLNGETLLSLYVIEKGTGEEVNILPLIAQLVLLLLLFYYLHLFAVKTVKQKGFVYGMLLLVGAVVAIRAIMLGFNIPGELSHLEIFNPRVYASSIIAKSLGDLIINCMLLVWMAFFAVYYKPAYRPMQLPVALVFVLVAAVFAYAGVITWLFKTLVMDSVVSFEVYNILSLTLYSLLGMISIALVIITHFVFTRNVLQLLSICGVNTRVIVVFGIGCAMLFSLAAINSQFYHVILFTAAWMVFYLLLANRMVRNNEPLAVRNIIVYIAVYSILTTYFIENLYERKERNQRKFFAGKLVAERDFVAEYMFGDIARRIEKDAFIKNFFNNPLVSKKEILDRVNALYLGGYFNKYDAKLFAFDASGNPVKSDDSTSLNYFDGMLSKDTTVRLQYLTDTAQNYSYASVFDFSNDSSIIGYLALRLVPKTYYGQNVYPELLLGSNIMVSSNLYNYDYAVYQNDKLIAQYGDYPYTYYWNEDYQFGDEEVVFIDIPGWEHNIQRFKNGKKVIVTVGEEPLFESVATFSYLFSFLFAISILVLIPVRIIERDGDGPVLFRNFTLSFRSRINYSMLTMIVVSFVIIGIITISYFRKQYDTFYSDRMERKGKVVHASLEYFIQQNVPGDNDINYSGLNSSIAFEVARLADINGLDVNLFDREGALAVSSQPSIYDKGLVSKKMNPAAYFNLSSTHAAQVTMQENIGHLKYAAIYSPIRNISGDAVAYLGIPYFERSKNINDEVSSFLVALMNVYVFLLMCAAILAYFISNSITRPLTIISEKLRILNLNKKNEPIEWNSKDEIGVLIGEYNKMITELERSARKLARSERESAWREMAKQIAHEIKNPLTPMKLSIQYLQRAIDEGKPDIEQLAKRVAKTLEEQIENLSSIATAFSSFAKMPKPENEIVNLNELLKSIAELFNRESNVQVSFSSDVPSPLVFTDKNQMISVFNNLVKNAIQSIPDGREGFVAINVLAEDDLIIIIIEDNGGGIPTENYDKVFVPNFTTKSSGTGLGLAISKQIIEGAGGKIWFESKEGEGTTFYVRLKKE